MKKTFLQLEDAVNELKEQLVLEDGKAIIKDKKWVDFFDALVAELIEARATVSYASGYGKIDWEFVNDALKKTREF